jgi:NDP-sugar pyrophosphorylase family protein
MTYGDTFTDLQLSALISAHKKQKNEATIVVAPIKNPFGLVEFNAEKQVTFFKEKPILNYFIGYAVINKSALELIPDKVINMPDGEGIVTFFKILMGMDLLGCYFHSGIQTTFNTPEELKIAKKDIVKFFTTMEDNKYEK